MLLSLLLHGFDIFHKKMLKSASNNMFPCLALLFFFIPSFALFPKVEFPGVGLEDPRPSVLSFPLALDMCRQAALQQDEWIYTVLSTGHLELLLGNLASI